MRMHLLTVVLVVSIMPSAARSEDLTLHTFERQKLTDVYFSEGANTGDINGDGKLDVVDTRRGWIGFPTRPTAKRASGGRSALWT